MSLFSPKLSPNAKNLIIQYALFRWENAVIIGGTIIVTGAFILFQLPYAWVWPFLGLVGVGALFYSSVTDERANTQLLLLHSQDQFNPRLIKSADLRQKLETALEYQRRIETQVRRPGADKSPLWDRPEDTADQLEQWIENIFRLARQLDGYQGDSLMAQERERVPLELEQLTNRRRAETNPVFQKELDQVLESKKKQLAALQAIETRMKQADLQLQQSLAALAIVDSQVRLLDAQDINSTKSENLRADIREQVNRLGDLIASLDEVRALPGPTENGQ